MGTNDTLFSINKTIYNKVVFDDYNSDPDGRFLFYNITIDMPSKIVSDGIWGNRDYGALISRATMPLLETQILCIFVITQCFHLVLRRLGFPYFVSQMMVCIYALSLLLSSLLHAGLIQEHVNYIEKHYFLIAFHVCVCV